MKYAFIIMVFTVLGLGHFYLWRRLVSDLKWRGWQRLFAGGSLVVLGGLLVASFVVRHYLDRDAEALISYTLFVWMIVAFYLALLLFLKDLVRFKLGLLRAVRRLNRAIRGLPDPSESPNQEAGPVDPQRRVFLERSYAGFAIVAAGSLTTLGVREAHGDYFLPEIEVGLARLKRQMDGLRIVQVSDLHVGPTIGLREVERVAKQVQALRPDLVVLTGDMVDGSVEELGADLRPLTALESRFGTYFVTGNHELYSGPDAWIAYWKRHNVRVLEGEVVQIGGDMGFDLAGIHDAQYASRLGWSTRSAAEIVERRDSNRELVLLAHQPIQIADAERMRAGLQLSGHTHGGQIFPFGLATALAQPYLKGWYRHSPQTQIYVNAGSGHWGPPVRLGVPPEITTIVLHSV